MKHNERSPKTHSKKPETRQSLI